MKKQFPNIVYILADDMGYGDVSCQNEQSKIKTENLDALAANGMYFTDAHSNSAVCTPTRYGVLTGRYCWRSSLKASVVGGFSPSIIEQGRMTVASFLKEHGYHTACIGKWHLGLDWRKNENGEVDFKQEIDNTPVDFGFDYFYGISASLDMPPYSYIENKKVTEIPDRIIPENDEDGKGFWREGQISSDFSHAGVLPKITEKAIEYINKNANQQQPFFLYFPLPAPHTPILPLKEFQGKSGTNEYGDFCLQVDAVVGQINETLEKNGISENTIFIFTSDNGCSPRADFKELAACGHNPSYVFRGHKADIYEGGHRVPFIIRWPEKISAGRTSDEVICLTDLMATCAEIVGDKLPDNAGEDSVSNLSVWTGLDYAAPLREATVHHSIDGSFSIRKGEWKLEMCPGSGGWSWPKPGEEPDGSPPIQLYSMKKDISEKKNVYNEYPNVVDDLKALLTQYVKNGRSTPGKPQKNTGPVHWPQLNWLAQSDLE